METTAGRRTASRATRRQQSAVGMLRVSVCCLLLTLIGCLAEILEEVTVETRYGDIRGRRHREHYDIGPGAVTDTVDVFLGVPYAAPPIGHLRFKPPQPPTRWYGVREATSTGPVCPQKSYYSQTEEQYQSEDCLSLNIYSPVIESDDVGLLPVMVFIHGGSYEEGAGSRYNGFTLAQHGVVVVTFNYRLGVLGFLTSGDETLPGNYGLMDQIEVLRWVSENIGKFRGESCMVTLFGSSAGSASAGLLMLSPMSRGLFHRVILQSGSPLSFWAVYKPEVNHRKFFDDVTDLVGCSASSMEDRIECLRKVHYSNFTHYHWEQTDCSNNVDMEIKRLLDTYSRFPRLVPSKLNFKPRVDGEILPDEPRKMYLSSMYQNVTVMIGNLKDEWARSMGWFFNDLENVDADLSDGFERDSFERTIHHVIRTRFSWSREVADAAVFMYTDWRNVTDPYVNREGYKDLMSDFVMTAPSVDLADMLTERGTTVYFYYYSHQSVFTDPPWWKCYHSLELDSVFGSPFIGYNIAVDDQRNHTKGDKEISRIVMLLWTNFAKYGNPTKEPVRGAIWRHMESSLNNYLQINTDQLQMKAFLRAEQMAFWNKLVPSLRGVKNMIEMVDSQAKPADRNLTLMWFFGILSVLSFSVTLALVVRNGKLQKKLVKLMATSSAQAV